MSDDEQALHDWFQRSAESLPPRAFAQEVAAKLSRRERAARWQRYAGLLLLVFSCWLLLPELVVPLDSLAALPRLIAETGGERWPLLVLVALGLASWLLRQARNMGYLRRS